MKSYLLRNIPDAFYRRVQHAAIDRGITVGQLIILAMEAFLASDGESN